MKIQWNKVTWYSKLLALALLVFLPFIGFYFGVQYQKNLATIEPGNPLLRLGQIVGGDKDIHGCIGSAGYSWCEVKQKCLRVWEEGCEAVPTAQVDFKAFINAKSQTCADKANKAYLIQKKMVFTAREGNCPDNSYFFGLYGNTPQEVFCTSHDSIAGPMEKCENPAYQEIFDNLLKLYSQFSGNLEMGSSIQAERIY